MKLTHWTQVPLYHVVQERAIEATSEEGKALLREYRDLGSMRDVYPATKSEVDDCGDLDDLTCIDNYEINYEGLN